LLILASALAIASKHALRVHAKHLFNPAALGAFLVVIFCKQATQWHGAYTWALIIPFGLYVAWRIKKLPMVIAYLAASILYALFQSPHTVSHLVDQIAYLNYFLVFIMLVEPKTSPVAPKEQAAFGVSTVVVSLILYAVHVPFDADLPALLVNNLVFGVYTSITRGMPRR
jgi:glycine betaine catabolism B